jgi:hypothetical protein
VIIATEYIKKPKNQDALHRAMHPSFDHTAKWFLLVYHAGVSVAGLLGNERRNDLEELSWQPVCARGWQQRLLDLFHWHDSAIRIGIVVQAGPALGK